MRHEKSKSPAMQMPTIFRVSGTPVSVLSSVELSSVSTTFAVFVGAMVPSAWVVSGPTVDTSAGLMLIRLRAPVAFAALRLSMTTCPGTAVRLDKSAT